MRGRHIADVEHRRSWWFTRVACGCARSRAASRRARSRVCLDDSRGRGSPRSRGRGNGDVSRGAEPGLARIEVTAAQADIARTAQAQITVTATLLPKPGGGDSPYQGLPGYTYHKASGELWRSRFDAERNLIVINNGHRDFVYAARNRMLKLRYICRLFAKELVLKNFIGIPPEQLLERLLELTLYTEENLR
jgi:hypothetical protein